MSVIPANRNFRDIVVSSEVAFPTRMIEACRELVRTGWQLEQLRLNGPWWDLTTSSLEQLDREVEAHPGVPGGRLDVDGCQRVEWILKREAVQLSGVFIPGQRWLHVGLHSSGPSELSSDVERIIEGAFPPEVRVPLPAPQAEHFNKLRNDMRDELERFRAEGVSWLKEAKEQLESNRATIQTIETTYDVSMALQAPVAYWADESEEWSRRAGARKCFAIWLGVAFVVALVVVGWLLVEEYGSAPPPYWMLFSLLLVFGLLVWILRLLVRAMFSDLHLAEEGKLRAVMTKTYIALLREKAADEKDRQLVLENIYRPVSSGLIGDETPPTTLGEIIRGFARSK